MATVAALGSDVIVGVAPLSVLFDASASTSVGQVITKYEFDWTNDGTYDLDSLTDPTPLAHVYAQPGVYTAKVRVSSDLPDSAVATRVITVRHPAYASQQAALALTDLSAQTPPLLRFVYRLIQRLIALLNYEVVQNV